MNFPWEKTVAAPTDAKNKPWRTVGPQKGLSCGRLKEEPEEPAQPCGFHSVLEAYGGSRTVHVTCTE